MPISVTLISDLQRYSSWSGCSCGGSAGGYWRDRFGVFQVSDGMFEVLAGVIVE